MGAAILAIIITITTTLQLISSPASAQMSVTNYDFGFCNEASYTSNDAFAQNLKVVSDWLIGNSSHVLYSLASSESSDSSISAYALYQCRGDLSLPDCSQCIRSAFGDVRSTSYCGGLSKGARVQLGGCFLRYESYDFFTTISTDVEVAPTCTGSANDSSQLYKRNLVSALKASATAAPQHPLFGYNKTLVGSGTGTAYVLTQCLGYLNASQCATCLNSLMSNNSKDCNGSVSGQVFSVDHCYYLFGNTPLVLTSSNVTAPAISPAPSQLPLAEGGRAKNHKAAIAGIVVGTVVLLAIIAALVLCFLKRQKKSRAKTFEQEQNVDENLLPKARARNFSLKELQDATDNFNVAKKLGEGGFGPVYQGRLTTGREVAIKMLSSHSRQGKSEFVNEVNLITTVQHRNLIQLLGCCDEDDKQLLVYEYLPNQSLDLRLFDVDEKSALDWSTRFEIIVGIARGLRYLHEDSPIRIIHRDIKASNILLDNSLVPKIADFGLARLFGDEASHLITRVVGTLGYLAPEYAIGGQLSEKADVYSFGLVVLEIVSGRRVMEANCGVDKQVLLEWTWALYEKHQQLQILDERMQKAWKGGSDDGDSMHVSVEEVVRVVHVALLCTQLQPVARPSMSEVYDMLSGQSEILNKPAKPMTIGMLSPFPGLPDDRTSIMFSSSTVPSQPSVNSMYSYDAGPISQVEAR